MKEKDLPIDLTKHKVYSKNAKKCVQKLLNRYYDEKTTARLWEKVQLQYCEYLKDEPALKDLKITTSIYDPIPLLPESSYCFFRRNQIWHEKIRNIKRNL